MITIFTSYAFKLVERLILLVGKLTAVLGPSMAMWWRHRRLTRRRDSSGHPLSFLNDAWVGMNFNQTIMSTQHGAEKGTLNHPIPLLSPREMELTSNGYPYSGWKLSRFVGLPSRDQPHLYPRTELPIGAVPGGMSCGYLPPPRRLRITRHDYAPSGSIVCPRLLSM